MYNFNTQTIFTLHSDLTEVWSDYACVYPVSPKVAVPLCFDSKAVQYRRLRHYSILQSRQSVYLATLSKILIDCMALGCTPDMKSLFHTHMAVSIAV